MPTGDACSHSGGEKAAGHRERVRAGKGGRGRPLWRETCAHTRWCRHTGPAEQGAEMRVGVVRWARGRGHTMESSGRNLPGQRVVRKGAVMKVGRPTCLTGWDGGDRRVGWQVGGRVSGGQAGAVQQRIHFLQCQTGLPVQGLRQRYKKRGLCTLCTVEWPVSLSWCSCVRACRRAVPMCVVRTPPSSRAWPGHEDPARRHARYGGKAQQPPIYLSTAPGPGP